jgi:hypothetical protein
MSILGPTNLPTYGYVSTYLAIEMHYLFIYQILIKMPCGKFLLATYHNVGPSTIIIDDGDQYFEKTFKSKNLHSATC